MLEKFIGLYNKFKEQILYIVFGVLTTAINIISFFLCTRLFGIGLMASNIIAWIASVIFAFVTNKIYVFDSRNYSLKVVTKELVDFTISRGATGVLDMGLMYLFVSVIHIEDMASKIIINIIVIILNYILSKLYVFKKRA
ncbi:GtrA family protein [Clostridium sardiniense]|uniref:GtrA family protein n=1 Tax=Clostridium sardiniense TaxID=29369 RepID=A0ABS7KYK4_CLOSR|nr:GtrA family protein [Clostridium sardiniense]MBY0755894.1 GtrA family protein [Clostridium sardiniense]MDQ0461376.1 putative flippase GtrA [Clostridium sardiniense]